MAAEKGALHGPGGTKKEIPGFCLGSRPMKLDDDWGYPHFRKASYVERGCWPWNVHGANVGVLLFVEDVVFVGEKSSANCRGLPIFTH